jgi:leucyl aminopeptidase
MTVVTTPSRITCTAMVLAAVEADLIIVPWFENEGPGAVEGLDAATGGEVARALVSKEFAARPFDLFVTPVVTPGWRARRVALLGAGGAASYGPDLVRKLATAGGLAARQRRADRAAFLLRPGNADPSGDLDRVKLSQPIAEGLTLAEFDAAAYKTEDPSPPKAPVWLVSVPGASADLLTRIAAMVERGRVLGQSSNLARELANEPANTLTPREFVRRAAAIAAEAGVAVEVLDEHRIAELGMGLLLGVSRGSSEPPRLLVLRYEPPGAADRPVLGLVGKGITFDTGGISMKSADGMERMKDDMAGGAAVACAMRALALLKAPIRVIGVVPAAENMPGGRAIKPGDILKSAIGKTVEVTNTDAEGRLILADGLWYARQLGATHLVDIATLTGACVVALGKITSGLFGTPTSWVEHVRRVADRAGDRVWPMPLFDEYREQLKSDIADFTNTGGRPGGSITAALFLKEFVGDLPWVHMDIAGTAWIEEARPYLPKGPSGVGVRTLAELASTSKEWM